MIAFAFAGQGSQRPHMGRAFVDDPAWALVDRASELTGFDVASLLVDADEAELRETAHAQICVLTHALMLLRVTDRMGLQPDAALGHSVGEFAALVAGGVLTEDDALVLVAGRGRAMAAACDAQAGGMAALRADIDTVTSELIAPYGDGVWVAAENAPSQVVLGGTKPALGAAVAAARRVRIVVRPLNVAGAFHTPLMGSATEALRSLVQTVTFRDASIPVAANCDGFIHKSGVQWPTLMVRQLVQPVRWRSCVDAMAARGVVQIVEFGASTTLTPLARRIAADITASVVHTPDDVQGMKERLAAVARNRRVRA